MLVPLPAADTSADPTSESAANRSPTVPRPDPTLPAPLQGCLYCHAEGSTALAEGRKMLGIGGGQVLICSQCGAVAQFEQLDTVATHWKIRYRTVSRAARYYYVWLRLGQGHWLDAETALAESQRGFIQRRRVQQTQQGDLSWLAFYQLPELPSLMSAEERVALTLRPASLRHVNKAGRVALLAGDDPVQDAGICYVTDRKLHLVGERRNWAHKLSEVRRVDQNERCWRAYLGGGDSYYQGENHTGQVDVQLFGAVIQALVQRTAGR